MTPAINFTFPGLQLADRQGDRLQLLGDTLLLTNGGTEVVRLPWKGLAGFTARGMGLDESTAIWMKARLVSGEECRLVARTVIYEGGTFREEGPREVETPRELPDVGLMSFDLKLYRESDPSPLMWMGRRR